MAAEHAAIGMQLVDDDVAQVLEEPRPTCMVRQHAGVKHVRVGENDVGTLPDRFARVLRRVAVVGEGAQIASHGLYHAV